MKWLPKGALIALLFSTALVGLEVPKTGENKPSYRSTNFYMNTSGITLTPGMRWQRDHFGFDVGIDFVLVMPVGVKVSGLYYFNPYSDSPWKHNMALGFIGSFFNGPFNGPFMNYGFQCQLKEKGYWFMNIGCGLGRCELIDTPHYIPMPILNIGYAF